MIDFTLFRRPPPPTDIAEPWDKLNTPWLVVPGATRAFAVTSKGGVDEFVRVYKQTTGEAPDVRDVAQVRYALELNMVPVIRIISAGRRTDHTPFTER